MSKKNQFNPALQALRREAERLVAGRRVDRPDITEPDLMKLIYEIEVQHVELDIQNQELRHALEELEESRNTFFDLYQTAPVPLVTVNTKGLIEQINEAAAKLLFECVDFLIGRSFATLILPEDQSTYFNFLSKYAKRDIVAGCELRLSCGKERNIHVRLEAKAIHKKGKHSHWRFGMVDITTLKKTKVELETIRADLEATVDRRTATLKQKNRELRREVAFRKQAETELQHQSEELKLRTIDLQEANIALKVLLKERDNERLLLEEKMISNLEQVVSPQLTLLAEGSLSKRQKTLVESIQRGINEILSPMNRRLIIDSSHLTPTETTVASLIRQGKSTKQIAAVLGVATSTIDFHRKNLRHKLNLTNKQSNLQSFLQSLS